MAIGMADQASALPPDRVVNVVRQLRRAAVLLARELRTDRPTPARRRVRPGPAPALARQDDSVTSDPDIDRTRGPGRPRGPRHDPGPRAAGRRAPGCRRPGHVVRRPRPRRSAGGAGSPPSGSACRRWARDAEDRTVYVSNATGRYEVSCWDVSTGVHTRPPTGRTARSRHPVRRRRAAVVVRRHRTATSSAPGARSRSARPGRRRPPRCRPSPPAIPPGSRSANASCWPASPMTTAPASTSAGRRRRSPSRAVVYRHAEDGGVGALSTDETIWVLSHSEHGDSRYPALRAFSLPAGDVIGELSDAPGKGLAAMTFSPIPGDQRLLVGHERRGREELLIWDPVTGAATELTVDLPGRPRRGLLPRRPALLVVHTHAGRTTVHRVPLDPRAPRASATSSRSRSRGWSSRRLGAAGRHDLVPLVQCRAARPAPPVWAPTAPTSLLMLAGRAGAGVGAGQRTSGWTGPAAGSTRCWPCPASGARRGSRLADGVLGARRPGRRRRGLLRREPRRLAGRRLRRGAGQLPRLHRLRLGVAGCA